MYSIEQYLTVLKKYVCKKSKPEGSIAEGYIDDEYLTFCARFLNEGKNMSLHDSATPNATPNVEIGGYYFGSRKNKNGKYIHLSEDMWITLHLYILFNYNDKDVEELLQ